jgi:predicted phosphate transport protein (TIGR00153 family)
MRIQTMGTFSKIFGLGDKKLQEQSDELLLKLSKLLQSASAKLRVAIKDWAKGNEDSLEELSAEIIQIERDADKVKDDLFERIFSKKAYLPQQTQDRHQLVIRMDGIIDATEDAIRLIVIARKISPPEKIVDLAKRTWICTDLLQDAIKYLFDDFERAVDISFKIDKVREEARDYQFDLVDDLLHDDKHNAEENHLLHYISRMILQVALRAEDTGDFIRTLAIKYS